MQLNNFTVVDRHNRPTTMDRVALRAFFINDGIQVDPYAISGVSIFKRADSGSILTPSGVAMGLVKQTPFMQFANTNWTTGDLITDVNDSAFAATNYDPTGTDNCQLIGTPAIASCQSVSGIYRASGVDGEFVVVLDGGIGLSSMFNGYNGTLIGNGASAVEDYIDVWTVKLSQTSDWQVLINDFQLFGDTFFSITQPMIFTARTSLATKHVQLGSKIKLTLPTEVTVENKDIDSSITNIFKQTAVTNAGLEIVKLNDDVTLASRVTVSSFADTSGSTDVTSDNTILFNWDTSQLQSILNEKSDPAGAAMGTYSVQVKYTLVDEIIYSPRFPLIVS